MKQHRAARASATGNSSRRKEKPEQVADEIRATIIGGEIADGEMLGHETALIERFEVSRPTLRESLRILETEGLVEVIRGVRGGVVVRLPDETVTARAASMLLSSRGVPLADVHAARELIEPIAARELADSARRKSIAKELLALIGRQADAIDDPEAFSAANAEFHAQLVALSGNQTLGLVTEMLNVIIRGAVLAASHVPGSESLRTRRRGIASQERLVEYILEGDGPGAEIHWRSHLKVVGKVLIGEIAADVVVPLEDT